MVQLCVSTAVGQWLTATTRFTARGAPTTRDNSRAHVSNCSMSGV
jgi:hypothetical protein